MKKPIVIIVSIMAVITAIMLLAYFGAVGIDSRAITEDEKKLLLTTAQFNSAVAARFSHQPCESFIAKTNMDGSLELEYEYDSQKDPNSPFLFFKSEAEINKTVGDAEESFKMSIAAYKTGAAMAKGRKIIAQPDFFTLGEQNYAARIEDDGRVVGHIILTRVGKIVHKLLTLGMILETRDEVETLLEPVLAESKKRQ
jgi:hypothetical protein